MGSKVQILAILSFSITLFATSLATPPGHVEFNILKYGAKADGKTDISKALTAAWKDACSSKVPSKVVIPEGTYLLGLVKLRGPCNAQIKIQVQGVVKAPVSLSGDSWITVGYVDNFILYGQGTFDGQGHQAWKQNDCGKNTKCKALPISLRLNFLTDSRIVGVTSLDSKNFHVNVLGCRNLSFRQFKIITPAESINTDGIHIGRSTHINITDSKLETGDDCISIGDGSQNIGVTRVTCGPGHGISIGSLGKYPKEDPVSGIYVKNCTLSNTDNGVRIKSWPAMYGGSASNIHFDDIVMNKVANPILIDQVYCPWNQCNKKAPSKVKISDVSFTNIRGTSTTPVAVQLSCSSSFPCKNVVLSGINLVYTGTKGSAVSECSNVNPIIHGLLKPSGCGRA